MKRRKVKIIFLTIGGLLPIFLSIAFYIGYVLNNITYDKNQQVKTAAETFDKDEQEILNTLEKETDQVNWSEMNYDSLSTDGVTNILLCGEEAIGEKNITRGRTDCIMIATINNKQKSLKLTSIMRDLYVKIPGYSNNKINASYKIGGIPLLMKTIETNFGIKLDGYVLINFDGFEKMIDLLGGVEINLSQKEASYLNHTNYITERRNRKVREGKQLLNGDQALGYSRVRYVPTPNGLSNDYGRNYRQKTVLTQLFSEYKNKNIAEILRILPEAMKLISTDLSKKQILYMVANVLTMKSKEIETYRVPIDGYYKGCQINKMAVLYITDMDNTRNTLHKYIFGTMF